jgi:hypothetical protein
MRCSATQTSMIFRVQRLVAARLRHVATRIAYVTIAARFST